ncbi:MAG: hypothetical protein IT190_07370, partial [Microbacteriaceae bacterium]|nr:hypothetical protein [Microbacteriaceae bacterium]
IVAVVLGVSFTEAQPAKAQTSCIYNCYYAYGLYVKNPNGTPFTGYLTIQSGGGQPTQTNKHFTNGVMDSGYIWSGFESYWWYSPTSGIVLDIYNPSTYAWIGRGNMTRRYSTIPYLPDVAVTTLW